MASVTLKEIIERNNERFRKIIFEQSDENALRFPMVYPEWKQGEEYVEKQRVRFDGKLWRIKVDLVSDEEPSEGSEYELIGTVFMTEEALQIKW